MDATYLLVKNFLKVTYEDLPAEVVDITKNEILDALAVAVAGFGQPGPKELLEIMEEWGGQEEAGVVGSKIRIPAPNSAQINATMMHSRDYDDVHETAVMHPGVVTVPSALAMSELKGGLNGKEFITAIALGVDMISRLGLASRPGVSPIKTGWHFTTLYGYPTAALTSGRILGLDEDKMLSAFGLAYHQCSGNGQCVIDGTLAKRMGPGFSVRGGVSAALMAQKGITGARNCLDGGMGLYKIYHNGEYDRNIITDDLGHAFEGINVSIKPYPCCRGVHASIDAALKMTLQHDIKPRHIREIVITTGEANHQNLCTPFEAKVRPRNPVDAQFSIPWGVATAILKHRVAMEDFTAAACTDPEGLELTAKVRCEVDPSLSHPRGIEPSRVKFVMGTGETFCEQVDLALGTPSKPMSFEDCIKKFQDIVSFSGAWMTDSNAKKAIELVADLENVPDVTKLIRLFTL